MNRIDAKIMEELEHNPKIPLTVLAKRLRISPQVADYRIKRLLKEKTILKFTPLINLKSLGLEQYRIFFTFSSQKKYTNKDIFNYLQNQPGIYWAARIGGQYDLTITLFVKDFTAFDLFLDRFNKQFPKLIKNHTASYGIRHYIYRHKYLSKDYSTITYGSDDPLVKLDELDYAILENIKNDCRQSALAIGNKLKVSYKTIINRIKALEKKKVILGYRLYYSNLKKQERQSFILLFSYQDYSGEKEKELLGYVQQLNPITQAIRLFGRWNLFLHVRSLNNEELQELVIQLRDRFNIINEYELIPVFEDIAINLLPM